jgi:nucleoside-diphosphate-sugar epimerase
MPCPQKRLSERLVRMLTRLADYVPRFPLRSSRVDALTYRHCYQVHKIEAELGYQHKISMTEGISELVRYAK